MEAARSRFRVRPAPNLYMKLTQIEFKLISEEWSVDQHKRSEGLHVSKIIRDIDATINRNKFAANDDRDDQIRQAYFTMGFVWERVILDTVLAGSTVVRCGEIKKDGVYLTPDAVNMDDWILEEWKCTWRSTNNNIERDYWSWWAAIKAYLHALNMDTCILRVMFVNGDYSKNRYPTPRAWRATFERGELESHWQKLLEHAKRKGWL